MIFWGFFAQKYYNNMYLIDIFFSSETIGFSSNEKSIKTLFTELCSIKISNKVFQFVNKLYPFPQNPLQWHKEPFDQPKVFGYDFG